MKKAFVFIGLIIVVILAAVFVFMMCEHEETPEKYSLFSEELINLAFYSQNSLALMEPVEVLTMSQFADGGSLGITFQGANGKKFNILYDQSREPPKDNRHIYICDAPYYEATNKVPMSSNIEKEVLKYLSAWRVQNFPKYTENPEQIIMFPSTGKAVCMLGINGLINDLNVRNQKR